MAREGIDVERSTLADWVGQVSRLLTPLADAIGKHVKQASHLHADDTTAPTLSPGKGRTQVGRYWTYVRDGRAWNEQAINRIDELFPWNIDLDDKSSLQAI